MATVFAAAVALSGLGVMAQDQGASAVAPAPTVLASAATAAPDSAPTAEPNAAPAAPAPSLEKAKSGLLKLVQISGFADAYASYNNNHPANGNNGLYNFDTAANSVGLNLAEIKIVRPVEKNGDLGFTTVFGVGDAIRVIGAADPSHERSLNNIVQAFVSYKAPIGKGLQLDFGRFVTNMGAEVIETRDNWNYSRSLLFSYAIPYSHLGLRGTYALNSKWSIYAMAVNGWNNVRGNNDGKSVGSGVTYSPSSRFSLTENFMTGPVTNGSSAKNRKMTDTVLTASVTPALSLMFNYDYGDDRVGGTAVRWQGAAAYLRYTFNSRFAITPRVEWFGDPQGFATGAPLAVSVREFTLTPEWKVSKNFLLRGEFRRDKATQPLFSAQSGGFVNDQSTLTSGAIFMF